MNYPTVLELLRVVDLEDGYGYQESAIFTTACDAEDELRALLANATECAQAREKLEARVKELEIDNKNLAVEKESIRLAFNKDSGLDWHRYERILGLQDVIKSLVETLEKASELGSNGRFGEMLFTIQTPIPNLYKTQDFLTP